MDPETSPTPISKNAQPYAVPGDWEPHRTRISALYHEHRLKDVMRTMEAQHGFRATEKMYKKRFAKWGLAKYNRASEMEAAARALSSCQSQTGDGKTSAKVFIRGREVPRHEVTRYYRRKRRRLADAAATAERASTPPTVKVLASPPCPPLVQLNAPRVAPRPPAELIVTHRAVRYVSDFIYRSFDASIWLSASNDLYAYSSKAARRKSPLTSVQLEGHLNSLHNESTIACLLFSRNTPEQDQEAVRRLGAAVGNIPVLAKVEHPPVLDRLPRTLLTILNKDRPLLARYILLQFAEAFRHYYGTSHRFHLFCRLLAGLGKDQLIDVLCRVTSAIYECFKENLGPFHRTTLAARYTMVRFGPPSGSESAQGYIQVVQDCEQSLGSKNPHKLRAQTDLCNYYKRQGNYVDGRSEAEKVIACTRDEAFRDKPRQRRPVMLCARAHSLLARCDHGLGNHQQAIVEQRICVELYKKIGGRDETAVIVEEMFYLREWLTATSNCHEAQIVNKEMQELQNETEREMARSQTEVSAANLPAS